MSLMAKLKRIFKKEDVALIEEEIPIQPNTCKYRNMTLYSPSRSKVEPEPLTFYVDALDENNNPIADETIEIKLEHETIKKKTNENGSIAFPLKLKPGRYVAEVRFPNGEYTQSIETNLGVSRDLKKYGYTPKETPKKSEPDERKVTLYAPNMKMYRYNEIQYYAKLRDYTYEPIQGEEIKFHIDGETYTSITDEEGFARLDIDLEAGLYPIEVEYEGSEKYNPLTVKSTLKILIRDIDKKLMIDVDHISMEFKVSNDKIDTLKEFIIRSIKKNKEKKEKITVLEDISFKVYKGDKLGILGFNGAGKSTLLKILSGIYEPTTGSVKTYGKIAPLLELGAGFDKNYTGKNNIYLKGAFLSMEEKFIDEKYDEIVEFSELGEFINYPVKNYSSGMKAKLGFSISTLVEPDILILDEILSVGDIKFKKKSAEKLNSMMKDGITVLLVSHSIPQIKKLCDRCIWIEDGKITMDGDAEEVCDAYLHSAKGIGKQIRR